VRRRIGHSTADYHLKNDADLRTQAEAAKARAIDLLYTRAFQRCLESDIEPIYWQGIVVGHVRKRQDPRDGRSDAGEADAGA